MVGGVCGCLQGRIGCARGRARRLSAPHPWRQGRAGQSCTPPLISLAPACRRPSLVLLQVFGKRYYDQMPSMGLRSTDSAYVLAFSVIMLNTDLHNTQVNTSAGRVFIGCWRRCGARHLGHSMLNTNLHNTQAFSCRLSWVGVGRVADCSCCTHAVFVLLPFPCRTRRK